MIIKNNNKKIIHKLGRRSLKANTLRNIFAILAIMLTTMMFTSLFTIGSSLVKTMEVKSFKMAGGYAHGSVKDGSLELFEEIENHPSIEEAGFSNFMGFATNKEFAKHNTQFLYMDSTAAKLSYCWPEVGNLPKSMNEIAMDTTALDLLKVPHRIGEKVTLTYLLNGEEITTTFDLSGYWTADKVFPVSNAITSAVFNEMYLGKWDANKQIDSTTGKSDIYIYFKRNKNLHGQMEKLITDIGGSMDETSPNFIDTGINWGYMSSRTGFDLQTLLPILLGSLLILFTGYLIIYNIFQISVIKDIKHYGLLKTIGTSPKQIRSLLRQQAYLLAVVGIPLGLISGFALGTMLFPVLGSMLNTESLVVSSHPMIFIFSACFSMVTILVSCRKPGKIASKVSPIEATRYSTDSSSSKKTKRKGRTGNKLHRFALANLLRNKKKTGIILLSMSLGLVILSSVYSFASSFNLDTFIAKFVATDFIVSSPSYFNFQPDSLGPTESIVKEINKHSSFKEGGNVYKTYQLKSETLEVNYVYGFDELPLTYYELIEGTLDFELFQTGKYVIELVDCDDYGVPEPHHNLTSIGDTIKLKGDNDFTKEYTVLAKVKLINIFSDRTHAYTGTYLGLPSQELKTALPDIKPMIYTFNAKEGELENLHEFIRNYTETKEPDMHFESALNHHEAFSGAVRMFMVVGGAASFLVGLIGLLNFMNSIITNMLTRRIEFAMLESIGMTPRQLTLILIFEGLYYAIFTFISSLILTVIASQLVVAPLGELLWFCDYSLNLIPLFIVTPIILIFAVIIPLLAHKVMNKDSIIERLRTVE